MRDRSFLLVAATVGLLLAGAVGVYAYDRSRGARIAEGVTIGGIDAGGLDAAEARAKLRRRLAVTLHRRVVVRYRSIALELSPATVGVRADIPGAVRMALDESREGNILSRTVRNLSGGEIDVALAPRISFSRRTVRRFARRVAGRIDLPARNARVDASGASLRKLPGRSGLATDLRVLERLVATALTQPAADRAIAAPVRVTRPRVTTRQLATRYPRFITVDRDAFRLRFYERLRLTKTYVIAVGQVGFETPEGLYHIQNKAVDPAWSVPNSAWAGELAGRVIPPGPDNPLKARWMGIYDGAGIHGTEDSASLGTAASRGCVRMSIPEVKELYEQVPVNTPIYIG